MLIFSPFRVSCLAFASTGSTGIAFFAGSAPAPKATLSESFRGQTTREPSCFNWQLGPALLRGQLRYAPDGTKTGLAFLLLTPRK